MPEVQMATSMEHYQQMYDAGLGSRQIATTLGVSRSKVVGDLRRCGIRMRNPNAPVNIISRDELEKLYVLDQLSADAIGDRYGTTGRKIKSDLRRFGIPRRKGGRGRPLLGSAYPDIEVGVCRKPIAEGYFDTIDTDDKAYILGLIWSDGCIHKDWLAMTLVLAEHDLELVQKVHDRVGGYLTVVPPEKLGHQAKIKLSVRSRSVCAALGRLGVCPRKDDVLPQVVLPAKHLTHAFVRGLVDGDGMVKIRTDGGPTVTFANRNDRLREIAGEVFAEISGMEPRDIIRGERRYATLVCGRNASVTIARDLYLSNPDALAIPRKRAMAQAFQEWALLPKKRFDASMMMLKK